MLFDNIKSKNDERENKLRIAKLYQENIMSTISTTEYSKFEHDCSTVYNTINALNSTARNFVTDFMNKVTSSMKKLFSSAVRLAFVKNNFYDINNSITFIQENKSFFTRSPLLESSLRYCLIGEILFLGGSRFIWGRGRSI
jgi:hypothetical protein